MSRKLKNLKITAVALCKQGANPDAHIMLYKSIDSKGGNEMKTLEEILKSLPEDEKATVLAEIEKAKQNKPDGDMEDLMDNGADEATEDTKGAKGNKQAKSLVKSLKDKVTELESKVTKSVEDNEEEMLKSLPEPMQKAFKKMKEDAEAAKNIAKAMQEEKVTKEYIAKAAVFKALPTKAEELGEILKSLGRVDAAMCTKLENLLLATNTLVEKGGVFKEAGKNEGDNTESDALAKLEKAVTEIVAKSQGMTKEQAYVKALQAHPELYDAYVKSLEDSEE